MFKSKFCKVLIAIIIAIIVLLLILSYFGHKTTSTGVTPKLRPDEIIAVSDVDAHSQSQMKVTIEGDSVTAIQGEQGRA